MTTSELIKILQTMPPNAVVVGYVPKIEGDDEAGSFCYEMDASQAQEVTLIKNEVSRVVFECDGMIR